VSLLTRAKGGHLLARDSAMEPQAIPEAGLGGEPGEGPRPEPMMGRETGAGVRPPAAEEGGSRERIRPRAAPDGGARQTSSFLAASLAMLPGPRSAAIRQIWRGLRTLLTGRPGPGQPGEPEGWLVPWHLRRGEVALRRQESEVALHEAARVLARQPDHQRALALRAAAQWQAGAWTAAAQTIRAQRRSRDAGSLRQQERAFVGGLIETDPRWLPWVPGTARPLVDRAPDTFLQVVSEAVPLEGKAPHEPVPALIQRGTELRSTTLTLPGSRPLDGRGAEVGSADHDLRLYAWRAARTLRDASPSLIWATSIQPGQHQAMLVALALREHLEIPVVNEVRAVMAASPTAQPAGTPTPEGHARLVAQETRMLKAANAIVTTSESLRDEIASRGVPRDTIFLATNGVDAATYRTVYDRVVTQFHARGSH
jgi:glycosyl transferase family 4